MSGSRGERTGGLKTPLQNHKWLKLSLEVLVRTAPEKQLDPLGSIAFQGRFIWPSVKYVDD